MKNIFQNICILTKNQRTHIVFIVLLFFVLSLIEILGLGLIPLVFMKGVAGNGMFLPLPFFDEAVFFHVTVIELAILIIIVYLVKEVVYIFSQYKINRFVFDVMQKNQMQLIHSVINSSFLDIKKTSVADHVNMIQLHINSASNNYLIPVFQILSNTIIVLSLFIFLSFISFEIVLVAIIFVGFLPVIYFKNIKGRAYELGKSISDANKNIIDLIKSLNQGWRVIKSLGCESYIESKFSIESRRISYSKLQHSIIHFLPKPMVELVLVMLVILSFAYLVNTESKIENVIGLMSLLGVAVIRLVQLTAGLMTDVSRIRSVQHLVEQLVGELQRRGNSAYNGNTFASLHKNYDCRDNGVALILDNISFRYPKAKIDIIRELSLNAKAGDIIGIEGESGVGKSTLMDIIMGFLPVAQGRVMFSGKDVCAESLISNSSYMTQESFIFNDSLFNNLTLGDTSISRESARNALIELNILKPEQARSDITLDSIVGEKGVSLSGGEAQRISLARTYAHKSKIVVLDEPTSSLDEENERIVTAYINKYKQPRITFIVSHRRKLLDICNVVYRLKDGRLE